MIYVKVLKYKGNSGGFAIDLTTRWTVSLVNEEKDLEINLDGFMSSGYGHSKSKYAKEIAEKYSKLLDIPIKVFSAPRDPKVQYLECEYAYR